MQSSKHPIRQIPSFDFAQDRLAGAPRDDPIKARGWCYKRLTMRRICKMIYRRDGNHEIPTVKRPEVASRSTTFCAVIPPTRTSLNLPKVRSTPTSTATRCEWPRLRTRCLRRAREPSSFTTYPLERKPAMRVLSWYAPAAGGTRLAGLIRTGSEPYF